MTYRGEMRGRRRGRIVEKIVHTCARDSRSITRGKHAENVIQRVHVQSGVAGLDWGRTRVVDNASARSGTMRARTYE